MAASASLLRIPSSPLSKRRSQKDPSSPPRKNENKCHRSKTGCLNCRIRRKRCSWTPPKGCPPSGEAPTTSCDNCIENCRECLGGWGQQRPGFFNSPPRHPVLPPWKLIAAAIHDQKPNRNRFLSFQSLYLGTDFLPSFPTMHDQFAHLPVWEPTWDEIAALPAVIAAAAAAAAAAATHAEGGPAAAPLEESFADSEGGDSPHQYSESDRSDVSPPAHLSSLPSDAVVPSQWFPSHGYQNGAHPYPSSSANGTFSGSGSGGSQAAQLSSSYSSSGTFNGHASAPPSQIWPCSGFCNLSPWNQQCFCRGSGSSTGRF